LFPGKVFLAKSNPKIDKKRWDKCPRYPEKTLDLPELIQIIIAIDEKRKIIIHGQGSPKKN
jgi:hypothetical protein